MAKIELIEPTTCEDLDEVRTLMRAFVAWHRRGHTADIALIDKYFDVAEFEAELAGLPGYYAPPHGRLVLARKDGSAAGCVALRDLGDGICEMKRMFIYDKTRGQGIGRLLAARIIEEAKAAGYKRMRLDTSVRQNEAIGLYQSSGFNRIEPYYPLSDDLKNWLVFMERSL